MECLRLRLDWEYAQRQFGGNAALRQWVKELENFAVNRQLYRPGDLAEFYSFLGDKDRAFYWLEQYRQNHTLSTAEPTETMDFKTSPWFDPIRSDPRFGDFLRRVGLSP